MKKKPCRHEWVIVDDSDGDWKYCTKCNKAVAL